MNFLQGTPLITTEHGTYPTAWGAKSIEPAHAVYYPCCGKPIKKANETWLVYEDGDAACTECAQAWCIANYIAPPAPIPEQSLTEPDTQLVLGVVA